MFLTDSSTSYLRLFSLPAIIFVIFTMPANARDVVKEAQPTPDTQVITSTGQESAPIQDNSFLIEEAYNQEFGVVQHINTFTRSWSTHQWLYSFTQEWPVPGLRHQLSYTLSYLNSPGNLQSIGVGDLALNYRYQLVGSGESRLALAPRFTMLLPSGDSRMGRGFGGSGVQFNVPLSWVISKRFVTHWNAGATIVPRAKDSLDHRAATTGYNLGQSIIWLASHRFNVMTETLWVSSESVVGTRRTRTSRDLLVSPGIRWAHNFANGLQIVPGIGMPLGVGPSAGERGIFLYLSFEHPFREIKPE